MSNLHQRRVEQERNLLQALIDANPGLLAKRESRKEPDREVLAFTLHKTTALIQTEEGLAQGETHEITVYFPRFFPSVPMEASLLRPVFHPNVHPENGFVCLWGRFSPSDTVVEAVVQLQRVLTWQLVNQEADHLMQSAALEWYRNPSRPITLPLLCQAVRKPEGYDWERTFVKGSPVRRRLS